MVISHAGGTPGTGSAGTAILLNILQSFLLFLILFFCPQSSHGLGWMDMSCDRETLRPHGAAHAGPAPPGLSGETESPLRRKTKPF